MKYIVIGCGNCGSAIVRAILASELCKPKDLLIIQRGEEKAKAAAKEFGCEVLTSPTSKLPLCDAVLFAIKPQDYLVAAPQFSKVIADGQFVISIMAGIALETLSRNLPNDSSVVRAMPNLPIRIRRGIVPFVCSTKISDSEREVAERIFTACGVPFLMDEEWKIDAATAVSGSGPGYLFYFAEALMNAAQKIGFSAKESLILVQTTFEGSSILWRELNSPASALKEQVRSKGGTTDRAYRVFESREFSDIITEAVHAAFERSKELNSSKL